MKGKGCPVGQSTVGKKLAGWRWGGKGVRLTFATSHVVAASASASASASPPPRLPALPAAWASLQSVCSHQSLCCQFPPTVVWQRWHRHHRGLALYRRRCAGGEGETEQMMRREDEIGTGGLAGATCQQHVNMTQSYALHNANVPMRANIQHLILRWERGEDRPKRCW